MGKLIDLIFGVIFVLGFGTAIELVSSLLGGIMGTAIFARAVQTSPFDSLNIFTAFVEFNGLIYLTILLSFIVSVAIAAFRGRSIAVGALSAFLGISLTGIVAVVLEISGGVLAVANTILGPLIADPNAQIDLSALSAAFPLPEEFLGFAAGVLLALMICTILGAAIGAFSRRREARTGPAKAIPRTRRAWAAGSTTSWNCPRCGKPLPPGAFTCPNCGASALE